MYLFLVHQFYLTDVRKSPENLLANYLSYFVSCRRVYIFVLFDSVQLLELDKGGSGGADDPHKIAQLTDQLERLRHENISKQEV